MKKKILLITLCLAGLTLSAQVSKTVNVTTAGELLNALTITERHTVTNLTITGTIDARDFKTMRDSLTVLSVLDIGSVTIATYTGTAGTYSPSIVYPANEIPIFAFDIILGGLGIGKPSLVSIVMPLSTTSIGRCAFASCNLISITIPNSVTSIGYYALSSCSKLTSIIIPNSVTSIGEGVFYNCTSLTNITIPDSVDSIKISTFQNCSGLTSVIIPASVTSIENSAFSNCTALTSITIPNSVISIGYYAFERCKNLNAFTVESTNINYSSMNGVLFNKNQTNLVQYPGGKTGGYIIPNSVTSIRGSAFSHCSSLTSIIIPASVTSIGISAFSDCSSLTSIIIPASVTYIGSWAFSNCSNLTSIYVNTATPIDLSSESEIFFWRNSTCTLYVPIGSKSLYQAANQWKDFTNIVEFATAVPSVSDGGSVHLYPNPVTNGFSINGLDGDVVLTLTDLNGCTILNKKVTTNEYIPVQSLAKGIYTVKLVSEQGNTIQKIIKQ